MTKTKTIAEVTVEQVSLREPEVLDASHLEMIAGGEAVVNAH